MKTLFDWNAGSLAEGLHCYRTQQFFEAHEHWESVWLSLREPEKSFLQSLIQVSAAFHHLRRGNRRGAISLLGRALSRLNQCSSRYCGLDVELLRTQAHHWLCLIQEGNEEKCSREFPEFRMIN